MRIIDTPVRPHRGPGAGLYLLAPVVGALGSAIIMLAACAPR